MDTNKGVAVSKLILSSSHGEGLSAVLCLTALVVLMQAAQHKTSKGLESWVLTYRLVTFWIVGLTALDLHFFIYNLSLTQSCCHSGGQDNQMKTKKESECHSSVCVCGGKG